MSPHFQFFDTFGYFGAVSNYDYNKGLQSLKARAKAENLGYLETMLKGGPAIDKPELETLLSTLNSASSAQQIETVLVNAYDFLASDADTSAKLDAYVKSLQDAAAGVDDEKI